MDLDFAFLAKSAEVGGEGTFHVLGGGIHLIRVKSVPFQLPAFAVVASFNFQPEECGGQYQVQLSAMRPDGSDGGLSGNVDLRPTNTAELPDFGSTLAVAVSVFGLELPQEGRYTINFSFGGCIVGAIQFFVVVIPQG
jgi:hypothetical protein